MYGDEMVPSISRPLNSDCTSGRQLSIAATWGVIFESLASSLLTVASSVVSRFSWALRLLLALFNAGAEIASFRRSVTICVESVCAFLERHDAYHDAGNAEDRADDGECGERGEAPLIGLDLLGHHVFPVPPCGWTAADGTIAVGA